jgi:transcriptional regulator with XRE-family HTH domain
MTKRASQNSLFPTRLRSVRSAARWSQAKLGKAVGVSAVTIHYWERDKCHPDEGQVATLAHALGVSVPFLSGAGDFAALQEEQALFNKALEAEQVALKKKHLQKVMLAARRSVAAAASLPIACVQITISEPDADDKRP